MANPEHVEWLEKGVEVWNQWRQDNLDLDIDLSDCDLNSKELCKINLSDSNLRGADFRKTNFSASDFRDSDLSGANFSSSILVNANLDDANLNSINLSNARMVSLRLNGVNLNSANLRGANLSQAQLNDADLSEANLRGAQIFGARLQNANLSGVNLRDADIQNTNLCAANLVDADLRRARLDSSTLNDANFRGADLRRASLRFTQALGTDFESTIFTAACLEGWKINVDTAFNDVVCQYFYLKSDYQERCPKEGSFQQGEFAALFPQAINTVELVFQGGVDWQAFESSFRQTCSQYPDQIFGIQAIEKKYDGSVSIRVEVPIEVNKATVERDIRQRYNHQLKTLEAEYEKQLRLQGEHHSKEIQSLIEAERQAKSSLIGAITTMAENQGSKYDLRGAQFAGGFAETVEGDQIGGTINVEASEIPSLSEAAAEIQDLLQQLQVANPTATEAEQTSYLRAIIPPTRRERFVSAIQSASSAAIDEVPYGPVLKALVDGWRNPEA